MEPSRMQGTQRDSQREGAVGSAREDRLRPCQPLLKPLKRQPTHGCDFYSDITKLCIREKNRCVFRSRITTTVSAPSSALPYAHTN